MKIDIKACLAKAVRNLKAGKSPLHNLKKKEIKALQNQFSSFVDTRNKKGFLVSSEHKVHSIDTPRPYLHMMASQHPDGRGVYASFWDETARGFSCLDSVLAGPVTSHCDTSYVPTCPGDLDYRAFYVVEESTRGRYKDAKGSAVDVWFLLKQPGRDANDYQGYECRQGLGEVTVSSCTRGIAGSVHAFVSYGDPVEIWTIRLKNTTRRTRKLKLFTRLNWGLRSYPAYYFDMRVVSSGLFDKKLNAVAAFNNDQNNKLPRSGVLMSDTTVKGFDLSREAFDGNGVFREFPEAVIAGQCRNSTGCGPLAGIVGALQQEITLKPGEDKVIHTLLGAASRDIRDAEKERKVWHRKYFCNNGVARELKKVRKGWHDRCHTNMVKTGDDEIDRFFNMWSKYQAAHQARFIRALDMVGYRDVIQDTMGICDFDPDYVRQELLTALSYQLRDGRAIRQYCKFDGAAHDLRMYMDSPVWIPDTLVTYIKETGDYSILDEKVGFFDMEKQVVNTRYKSTIYNHTMQAVRSSYDFRGQKGLCLVGHGDWNDALDGIGRGGKGVSTWLTVALVYAAGLMRSLAEHLGKKSDVKYLTTVCETLTRAVNRHAWDGEHYVYGFNDKGEPIGSAENLEGKIHLNVNSWVLLSGVAVSAGAKRVQATLKAIADMDTPLGHVLLKPCYTNKSAGVGRIADMLPGLFENGAIYTHGQSFVTAAYLELGSGDQAWETIIKSMPSRTLPAISTVAPHQQSNFTAGPDNPDFGKNYYSNFTGSLNWYRKNLIRMFGVMADFDGLRIDPCVPSWLKQHEISKMFRGCRYNIKFDNSAGVCTGIKSIVVDGVEVQGNLVPLSKKRTCSMKVVMG
ncbi:MAG: hypothetical protein KAH23_03075 [Kiritimatiellae bacterium]|nr:hypothetical protein [Kiritimatiellia bacterium]